MRKLIYLFLLLVLFSLFFLFTLEFYCSGKKMPLGVVSKVYFPGIVFYVYVAKEKSTVNLHLGGEKKDYRSSKTKGDILGISVQLIPNHQEKHVGTFSFWVKYPEKRI